MDVEYFDEVETASGVGDLMILVLVHGVWNATVECCFPSPVCSSRALWNHVEKHGNR